MLGDVDLPDAHAVERVRRSVAMLPSESSVPVQREDLLRVLQVLKDRLAPGSGLG